MILIERRMGDLDVDSSEDVDTIQELEEDICNRGTKRYLDILENTKQRFAERGDEASE
jgi:hypothetical protein